MSWQMVNFKQDTHLASVNGSTWLVVGPDSVWRWVRRQALRLELSSSVIVIVNQ
jgi:hypothetical protein